jgi:hypothetical protein
MKKKLIALMLSALMCASLFTACSGQSKAPITDEEETEQPADGTETETEETETDPEDTEENADKSGEEQVQGEGEGEEYEEGTSQEDEYYEVSTGLDLDYLAQILIEIQPEKGNEKPDLAKTEDQELIGKYYPGLSDMNLLQQICYMPPEEGAPCEIMLVECRSNSDASRAMEIFQTRINQGTGDGWKNAKTFSMNNLAAMVCLPEGSYIPENLFILD